MCVCVCVCARAHIVCVACVWMYRGGGGWMRGGLPVLASQFCIAWAVLFIQASLTFSFQCRKGIPKAK